MEAIATGIQNAVIALFPAIITALILTVVGVNIVKYFKDLIDDLF